MMKNYKNYLLIGFAAAIIIMIWLFTQSQKRNEISTAVSQNKIEILEATNENLETQIIGYNALQDSLVLIGKSLNRQLGKERAKYALIASNYAELKAKVKQLPDDSAVGMFLDRADCPVPVVKYDSMYLIPIEAIGFHNVLAYDLDEQRAVNMVLRQEITVLELSGKTFERLAASQAAEVGTLQSVIGNIEAIGKEKDKQIRDGEKLLKKQKVKTWL